MKNGAACSSTTATLHPRPGDVQASARMSCKVTTDITLTNVQSHMHKRGMNYQADLRDERAACCRRSTPTPSGKTCR